jgi:hypothetical protein
LKQKEKISNLENASQNLIHLPLTILQKDFEKNLQKNLQNKTCGASVVQYVKNEETIHAYLVSMYIGSIPSNLCTYIMQTSQLCTFTFALVCVGINHQKGEIERELGLHLVPN